MSNLDEIVTECDQKKELAEFEFSVVSNDFDNVCHVNSGLCQLIFAVSVI